MHTRRAEVRGGFEQRLSPLPYYPVKTIRHQEWPVLARFHREGAFFQRDIAEAQDALGKAAETGGLLSSCKGVQAQIIYWDGRYGHVVGYEPREGKNVGFGHIYYNPQKGWREKDRGIPTYTPEYVVAENYAGNGIGEAMARLLEDYAAFNTHARGARIFSTIGAKTTKDIAAMCRILAKLGATEIEIKGLSHYERIVLQSEWFRKMGNPELPYVVSTVQSVEDTVRRYENRQGTVFTQMG